MNITTFIRDNGACGEYRVNLPYKTASFNKGFNLSRIEKGDGVDKIEKALDFADWVLIPRLSERRLIDVAKTLQKKGKRIAIDYDDDMFNISPLSPHYEEFGLEEVNYNLGGEQIEVWKDKVNIDLTANRARMEAVVEGLRMADMVTVTTDILKDRYSELNGNIKVVPNCIDIPIWNKLDFKPKEEIRIGWAGGSSHYEDMCLLTLVLPEIMKKHPATKLVLVGAKFDGMLKGIPSDRIEFHEWCPTPAHPYRQAILNFDIALIPLVGNDFNSCKSVIKWTEFSGLSVPSVVSNVQPYSEVSGDTGVFVDNEPDAWIEGISHLIENKKERIEMGKKARTYVENNFNIHTQWQKWVDLYKGV